MMNQSACDVILDSADDERNIASPLSANEKQQQNEQHAPLQSKSLCSADSKQQLSPYRYLTLLLFCLLSMSNAYQWLQYSIIQNISIDFYGVSAVVVDWTSLVYMVAYVPLIFPATWLLDRHGLRVCVTTGAALNCIGALVKLFSANRARFAVALVGQSFCAVAQVFILNIPAPLAAVWFGPREVSTACAVGVFGNQIGVALGFVLPPLFIRAPSSSSIVENDLLRLFSVTAATAVVILLAILLFFRAQPSQTINLREEKSPSNTDTSRYEQDLIQLLKNRNFIFHLLSFGINTGIYWAIGTRLNFIILHYFSKNSDENAAIEIQAGFIGLTIVLAGLFGSILCGVILDRTGKYRSITVAVYFCSLCATVGFALSLHFVRESILMAFLIAGALGVFMTGYLPVGFEFGVELTYPVHEGTSSGMLNASSMLFGILITLALGVVHNNGGSVFWGNIGMAVLLAVGFVLTLCVDGKELKRTTRHNDQSSNVSK